MGQLGGGYRTGSSMLVSVVLGMVTLFTLGQAYPTINLQGYTSVPAVPGIPTQNEALTLNSVSDTVEVEQAKQEFMTVFRQAMDGLLGELAPKPVQDTREVREAKEEFFRIFDKALNGVIETVFIRDTEEVRARKEEFFGTFDSAVSNLITTVEENYLEDTSDVKAAKARFSQAFADAEAGKIGAQYLEDTPEVKAAKERFFRFFDFVLSGMLHKLAPVPGQNVIPAEIADFYIKDEPEVAQAKTEFDELYRNALGGDLASALALTVLADKDGDVDGAVKELEDTLVEIEEEERSGGEDEDINAAVRDLEETLEEIEETIEDGEDSFKSEDSDTEDDVEVIF